MACETDAPVGAGVDVRVLHDIPHQPHPATAPPRPAVWNRTITPAQILKSFNTRAFKRQQPDNPELMLRFIAEACAHREPVRFVLYWGKGLRSVLAAPEFVCLDYIRAMMARVADVYERGTEVMLVFTDTHATLNGHAQSSIDSYFHDLEKAASRHKFSVGLLSALMNTPGLLPDTTAERRIPPDDILAELRLSAAKWFRGEGSAEDGAIRYFRANMIERKVMERAFPRSIFITFNGSHLRMLFPENLPIFYMFSLRHGISDKPWFLPADCVGRDPCLTARPSDFSHARSA